MNLVAQYFNAAVHDYILVLDGNTIEAPTRCPISHPSPVALPSMHTRMQSSMQSCQRIRVRSVGKCFRLFVYDEGRTVPFGPTAAPLANTQPIPPNDKIQAYTRPSWLEHRWQYRTVSSSMAASLLMSHHMLHPRLACSIDILVILSKHTIYR